MHNELLRPPGREGKLIRDNVAREKLNNEGLQINSAQGPQY